MQMTSNQPRQIVDPKQVVLHDDSKRGDGGGGAGHMSLKLRLRHNSTAATAAERSMHNLLSTLDKDGDGHIDATELYYGIKQHRDAARSWKRLASLAVVGSLVVLGVGVGLMVWANTITKDASPIKAATDADGDAGGRRRLSAAEADAQAYTNEHAGEMIAKDGSGPVKTSVTLNSITLEDIAAGNEDALGQLKDITVNLDTGEIVHMEVSGWRRMGDDMELNGVDGSFIEILDGSSYFLVEPGKKMCIDPDTDEPTINKVESAKTGAPDSISSVTFCEDDTDCVQTDPDAPTAPADQCKSPRKTMIVFTEPAETAADGWTDDARPTDTTRRSLEEAEEEENAVAVVGVASDPTQTKRRLLLSRRRAPSEDEDGTRVARRLKKKYKYKYKTKYKYKYGKVKYKKKKYKYKPVTILP